MIRVGVVGLGAFGEAHIQAYQSLPGVEVAAVCSRSEARVQEICQKYSIPVGSTSWDDIARWHDVQAVSITTAEGDHVLPSQIAARAGKHLLVEKPLATSREDALQIAQAAVDAGVILMPGHILRYTAPYAVLKERIAGGELGRLVSLYARRHRLASLFSHYSRVHPAFITLIHDVDVILWLVDSPVVRIHAHQRRVLADQPDAIWCTLEFQNGTIAHLESAWILPDGGGVSTDDALEVLGTKGKASISLDEGPLTLRTGSGVSYPDTLYEAPVFGERFGGLAAELSDFVRSVAQGRPPQRVSPDDGVRAVEVVEAIVQAADETATR